MAALDTDCNGATVGSIVGAAMGRKQFNSEYADPLNDRVAVSMIGFQSCTLIELAQRHLAVWQQIDQYNAD